MRGDAGVASADEVQSWAESELLGIADARDIPGWFIDLAQYGPERLDDVSLPWRTLPPFQTRFALHAIRVDLGSHAAVARFAHWLAGAAMAEDPDLPEVTLGYVVDHCLDDMGSIDLAVQRIRESLPSMLAPVRAELETMLGRRRP